MLDTAALLAHCTKAKFGDASQRTNRKDPNVRVASELATGAWELCDLGRGLPHFLSALRDRASCAGVQAALVGDRRVVELVPQKVNVDDAGGIFAERIHTPTDARHMVGTVLVCLPSSHLGGALVVKHKNADSRFDFANESGGAGVVQWAALYSDCLYTVEQVTAGCSVTIAYSILARKGHPSPSAAPGCCPHQILELLEESSAVIVSAKK